jgi:hypothetical protein
VTGLHLRDATGAAAWVHVPQAQPTQGTQPPEPVLWAVGGATGCTRFPSESENADVPLLHAASLVGASLPDGTTELSDRAWFLIDFQTEAPHDLGRSCGPPLPDENTTERTASGLKSPGGLYFPLSPADRAADWPARHPYRGRSGPSG